MVAVAAAVAMTATACGSSQPAAKIPSGSGGTSGASSASAAATSSASSAASSTPSTAPSTAGSPTLPAGIDLSLPSDVTLQFNLPTTGDPAKDAALQALTWVETAKYKATETGLAAGPIVDDFAIQDARESIKSYLLFKQGKGETVTGTNVYYNWKFAQAAAGDKAFQITYCEDQNKFPPKNRATGKAVPQQSGLAQFLSLKVNMIVDTDGRWKAAYYTWKSGDVTCQAAEGH